MAAAVDDLSASEVQLERRLLDRCERALAYDMELEPSARRTRARDLRDRVLLARRERPVDDGDHVEVAPRRREVSQRGRAVQVDADEAVAEKVLEALRELREVGL